ncbi:mediator of RNA polymerase II transcription subunit 15 isoform X2 [Aplysia californica]|uniref:Mediator of RNA polymerase II transcription subunit 15 n=1 Tax=Aplysia californica TaxID=6500 RepID=A0ABM0K8N1_APLCA|nr:mediator of RNA polymerase II transcription subunit 15 isoform X1 [Aplysia californica]XP_035829077.1 mediator of RNA polymerase II transcription subunit 15 isoform X2 [Aplysia californica]
MADTQAAPVEETAPEVEKKTEEEPEEPESDEWKAEKYRNKVVERIQDEITKTESQVPKSAAELEEFVFSKAKSRKDYLDLVARLLIYVSEFNKKRSKDAEKDAEDGEKKDAEEKAEGKEEEKKEEQTDS